MKILIVTDAWHPQVNGVVRTYERLAREVAEFGAELCHLTPEGYGTVPIPTYPEVRLSLAGPGSVARKIEAHGADYIHIATEGPLGLLARRWCLKNRRPFTTCYHTRFPEYLAARLPVPISWGQRLEVWFHNAGVATMVAAPSLQEELRALGFKHTQRWTRGVDTALFRPRKERTFGAGPIFVYMGRVSVEKNLEAFLDLKLPGRKVVIGDGPVRGHLERLYPNVHFTGRLTGEALALHLASCDVFVFPSLTDTFGIVLLEAMASGLPVAAYPVTGPLDVVRQGVSGVLDKDLGRAALQAMELSRDAARDHATQFSWQRCARLFIDNIRTANHTPRPEVAQQTNSLAMKKGSVLSGRA